MTGLALRRAGPADADAVAALHVASWRSAYRGILDDAYLDGPIAAERLALWRARLAEGPAADVTVVAEAEGAPVGFGCLVVDEDPVWGSLVANLHADPARRGLGIGRELMADLAARARATAAHRPVHLFCLALNGPARAFYEKLGGAVVERTEADEPDGRRHPVLRYAWPTPAALAEGCAGALQGRPKGRTAP